jgi:hypothetical protein
MRRVHALLFMVVAGVLGAAAACGGGDTACEASSCAGSGGEAGSGGGGAGGAPCVVDECAPGDDCRDAACVGNACGFSSHPDGEPCGAEGKLQCSGGVCKGCMAAEDCSPKDCRAAACKGGACEYTLSVDGGCGPNGAGQCSAQGVCALCDDGKKNGDETGVDCGGHCGATCTTGQGCASKADCESDSQECADGVCCNTACDAPCFSCALPGAEGVCLPFAGVDPGACEGASRCSPGGVCAKATGGSCGSAAECASGLCASGACAVCDAQAACAEGQACFEGSCVAAAQPAGAPCAGPAACESGFCVDGVCCDTACDGLCEGCNTVYTQTTQGKCYFMIAGYDPQSECDGPGLAGVCIGNGQCGQP